MSYIQSRGVEIHYEVHGDGRPVVLLHGGTVNFEMNYVASGWVKVLNDCGYQVIGVDFRGHGKSGKPHDAIAYGTANLAADVMAVLDTLNIGKAALVAYSIGTVVALDQLKEQAERFSRAVLVATGDGLLGIGPHTFDKLLPAMQVVLERNSYPKDLPKHIATYWNFIEATKGDWVALKAFAQAQYPAITKEAAASIRTPTLILSGEKDAVLGQGQQLAYALANGEYMEVRGADHFSLAVDPSVRAAVVGFLSRELAGDAT